MLVLLRPTEGPGGTEEEPDGDAAASLAPPVSLICSGQRNAKGMSRRTPCGKVKESLLLFSSPGSEEGRQNLEMAHSSESKRVKDGQMVTVTRTEHVA